MVVPFNKVTKNHWYAWKKVVFKNKHAFVSSPLKNYNGPLSNTGVRGTGPQEVENLCITLYSTLNIHGSTF